MRVQLIVTAAFSLLALASCGGGGSHASLAPESESPALQVIRVFSADGNVMDTGALSLDSSVVDATVLIELRVEDQAVLGCELAYDPASQHVGQVIRGDYFGDDDIFLAVTDISGLAAIGGCSSVGESRGSLLATVYLEPGATQDARAVSRLPTSESCMPAEFDYEAEGTTATFSWIYSNTGDYDQNGEVNVSDISPIASNFGVTASGSSLLDYNVADGDLNGEVSAADLVPISANYQTAISGFAIERSSAFDGPFSNARDISLSGGSLTGRVVYEEDVTDASDGEWYRVRAYSSEDPAQGAACSPLQVQITPAGTKPEAVAAAEPMSGNAPLDVTFTAAGSSDSDGVIVSYVWDLDGDGVYETDATASGGTAQHTYTDPGSYNVRLKVMDNDGLTDIDPLTITANLHTDFPPVAYAYALPAQGWAPLTVNVSGFMSEDPDGEIVSWEWDFDGHGTYETAGSGDWGYASHTYNAGSYTAELRVTDDDGNTATSSVAIEVRDPANSSVDYWNIFDANQVKRVEFYVSQANWDAMWVDINAELEVEADAVVFPGTALEATLPSIGFRMKGNSSLNTTSDKKPWKLDTNEFDDEQEFENLKMLIFNNGFKDPSLTRERLAYEMMQAAGVQAGFTCYTEVWISVEGAPLEFWGIYTMVEDVDKKFLKNRFDNKGGNLYKCQTGSDLRYYGPDIVSYPVDEGEPCYQKETNEDEADYSDIINLCYVLDGQTYGSPAEFSTAIEEVLNVDSFLRYLAVVLSHSNLDIFMYMNQNYYLYNNEDTGKFEWIPWDLNEAWGLFGQQTYNEECPLYEMGGTGTGGSMTNPLFTQVMEVPAYRQTYAAYVDLLRRSYFTEANIATRAEDLHDLAASSVEQGDKMYYGDTAVYSVDAFHLNWESDYLPPPPGPGVPPGFFAFGVTSFTETRWNYIDEHLFADL